MDDVVEARVQELQVAALIESVIVDDAHATIANVKEIQVWEFLEKNIRDATEL